MIALESPTFATHNIDELQSNTANSRVVPVIKVEQLLLANVYISLIYRDYS